jgi:hypothetical protein
MRFPADLRKALLRNVARNGFSWSGIAQPPDFYGKFFDLTALPSTDSRYEDASGDMWQHTVNNDDWSDSDIVNDDRFSPLQLSDEDFARFINGALDRETRPVREELELFVRAIEPVVAHAGAKVVERREFGVFEGYKIVDKDQAEPTLNVEQSMPANWQGTARFRLFVSHIAIHRDKATRVKACLAVYGIEGFVAHEDIEPTLEWQSEIEKALQTMDAFLAIHTPGFSKSIWTQQEIGYAVARGVKIISLKMGEDPTGFISKQQALARRSQTAEEVAAAINTILSKDPRTRDKLATAAAARQPR